MILHVRRRFRGGLRQVVAPEPVGLTVALEYRRHRGHVLLGCQVNEYPARLAFEVADAQVRVRAPVPRLHVHPRRVAGDPDVQPLRQKLRLLARDRLRLRAQSLDVILVNTDPEIRIRLVPYLRVRENVPVVNRPDHAEIGLVLNHAEKDVRDVLPLRVADTRAVHARRRDRPEKRLRPSAHAVLQHVENGRRLVRVQFVDAGEVDVQPLVRRALRRDRPEETGRLQDMNRVRANLNPERGAEVWRTTDHLLRVPEHDPRLVPACRGGETFRSLLFVHREHVERYRGGDRGLGVLARHLDVRLSEPPLAVTLPNPPEHIRQDEHLPRLQPD